MSSFIVKFTFLLSILTLNVNARPGHDDDPFRNHIHIEVPHPHAHQIRLRSLIFGALGSTAVMVAGYLLYHHFIQRLRGRRNQAGGAAFAERGPLLPIYNSNEHYSNRPLVLTHPIFAPLRSLRGYMDNAWNPSGQQHPSTGFNATSYATYQPPKAPPSDTWEHL